MKGLWPKEIPPTPGRGLLSDVVQAGRAGEEGPASCGGGVAARSLRGPAAGRGSSCALFWLGPILWHSLSPL